MSEDLSILFERIKVDSNVLTASEAQTSQGVVLPILHNLKWNIFDTTEVNPEYTVGGKRVDFALQIQGVNKVFLEIKKTAENLDNHQEQLVYYAFQQGVKLAILTNGITWQFYLPLEEGSWEQRRFFTIDLMEQSATDVTERFDSLLSRRNVESGQAYQRARSYYEGRQKNKIVKDNLPKAWVKLVSEPDEMLVELLNETLERISGYKAEYNQVAEFLRDVSGDSSRFPLAAPVPKPKAGKIAKGQIEPTLNNGTVVLDPDKKLENLLHTKVIEARLGVQKLSNSWRSVVDFGLREAFAVGNSLETVRTKLRINIIVGLHNRQGFGPIEGTDYSWQNQDANYCAANAVRLAKLLRKELYVRFVWKEKGKFPAMNGIIHWKPND